MMPQTAVRSKAHDGEGAHDHDASDAGSEIQAAQRAMYDLTMDAVMLDTAMLPEEVGL